MTAAEIENDVNSDTVSNTPSKTPSCVIAKATPRKKRTGLKTVLVSGVGFFADAYDLFVIDFVKEILTETSQQKPTSGDISLLTTATLVGAVVGQLCFGVAADFMGRRLMFMITAVLCTFGAIACSLVGIGYQTNSPSFSIFHQLALCRFLLGIGIGGEYPLSATVASEADENGDEDAVPDRTGFWYFDEKPNSIASVFSMQGVGMVLSPLFVLFFVGIGVNLESTWRFCLGFGAIPSSIAFFFRWRMHETAAYKNVQRDLSLAQSEDVSTAIDDPKGTASSVSDGGVSSENSPTQNDVAIFSRVIQEETARPVKEKKKSFTKHLKYCGKTLKEYRMALVGTALTWFLMNITFYGNGSFKSNVVSTWFPPPAAASGSKATVARLGFTSITNDQDGSPMYTSPLQMQREVMLDWLHRAGHSGDETSTGGVVNKVKSSLRRLTDPPAPTETSSDKMMRLATMGTVVAFISIPGYILSIFFIHKTGLKRLQFWGFIATGLTFLVLALDQYLEIEIRWLEILLFGMTFLFTNFGPNTTTFILPTTIYPSAVRATCHGFSAAMGKTGGVLGTSLFGIILEATSLAALLTICGSVAFVGALVTWFFVPTDAQAKEMLKRKEREMKDRVIADTKAKEFGAVAVSH